jgi:hypothetical protein
LDSRQLAVGKIGADDAEAVQRGPALVGRKPGQCEFEDLRRHAAHLAEDGAAALRQEDLPHAAIVVVEPPLDPSGLDHAVDEARNADRLDFEQFAFSPFPAKGRAMTTPISTTSAIFPSSPTSTTASRRSPTG